MCSDKRWVVGGRKSQVKRHLTVHITSTLSWLGAIGGFLALAIAGLRSNDLQLVRSTYLAMELIGWYVLVRYASLLTGLIMSLGTTWGYFVITGL